MNESDLIVAYNGAEKVFQGYVSIFISGVFAYIVVAYLVGAKLTRPQASILTIIYSFFGVIFLNLLPLVFGRMMDHGSDILAIDETRVGIASMKKRLLRLAHLF